MATTPVQQKDPSEPAVTAPAPVVNPFESAVVEAVDKLTPAKAVDPFVSSAVEGALASGQAHRVVLGAEDAIAEFIRQAKRHIATLEGTVVGRFVREDAEPAVRFVVKHKVAEEAVVDDVVKDAASK